MDDSHLTLGYEKYNNDGERYYNEQFFFKEEHKNVIKLIFDDILSVKKDVNGLTTVKLTNDNFRQGADIKKLPNVKKTKPTKEKPDENVVQMRKQIEQMKQMHSFCGLNLKYTFESIENAKFVRISIIKKAD